MSVRLLFTFFAFAAVTLSADAHRLDEYLQTALIEISRTGVVVQLYLVPGVEVAERVIALADRDKDGKISDRETTAYATALNTQLAIAIDEHPLKIELIRAASDPLADLKAGTGNIRIALRARFKNLEPGQHVLRFENRHEPAISVYLVNALLPHDTAIEILKQERNNNQSTGRIRFDLHPPAKKQ